MGQIRSPAVSIGIGLAVILLTPDGAPPQAPGGLPAESLALRLDTLPGYVSPGTAFNYSLLGTVLTVATLVAAYPGFLFGPSLGYFHAGQPGRAWTGIGIRALATGGMISASAICDIATVKGAARRQNERLKLAWSISPTYAASRGEVGLQLRLMF